jgi:hypothetical protein
MGKSRPLRWIEEAEARQVLAQAREAPQPADGAPWLARFRRRLARPLRRRPAAPSAPGAVVIRLRR